MCNCLSCDCDKKFEKKLIDYGYITTTIEVPKDEFNTGAMKDKKDKLRFDLIPPEVEKGYAEVLSLGANKYNDRNWEKGIPFMDCVAALKRHLNAWEHGTDINTTDGNLNHLKHVLFWAAALVTFTERSRIDLDNRPITIRVNENVKEYDKRNS